MSNQETRSRIAQLVEELDTLGPSIGAKRRPNGGADGSTTSAPRTRFEQLRDDAVRLCRDIRGAQAAAMQMASASYSSIGARTLIDLLNCVSRDLREQEPDAA